MKNPLVALQHRFDQAGLEGDLDTVDRLVADGFQAVGPHGQVLDKGAWLAGLTQVSDRTLATSDLDVRTYGDAAVIREVQLCRWRDGDRVTSLAARVSHVWVRCDEWRLVGLQVTPLDGDAAP